jgi:CheY-like chemotaxis protein
VSSKRPPRILVVDDGDAVRAPLLRAFQGEGYEAVPANGPS